MRIANDRPLNELQTEFSSAFPFLEITFHRESTTTERLAPGLRVGEVRNAGGSGLLYLNGDLSATGVEQTFEDVFGLRANIGYRRGVQGHCYKAAKTLRELNNRAMQLCQEIVFV
ncbi:MAG: hypothetical protein IPM82_15680 [Saprospiraceae bacterium]|nr:hypothetical protein [Saprospiraceae bacterium]